MSESLVTGLVQRLNRPIRSDGPLANLSRVFGGGSLGLSKAAWDVVGQVFDFDYMGAAEYEFGAVRDTLRAMIENRADYRAFDFTIAAKDIEPGWWRKVIVEKLRRGEVNRAKSEGRKPPRLNRRRLEAEASASLIVDRPIFGLCPDGVQAQAEDLIRRIARADRDIYIKGGAAMDRCLDPDPEHTWDRVCGWLDLRNDMAWFMDRQMRDDTALILGMDNARGSSDRDGA